MCVCRGGGACVGGMCGGHVCRGMCVGGGACMWGVCMWGEGHVYVLRLVLYDSGALIKMLRLMPKVWYVPDWSYCRHPLVGY